MTASASLGASLNAAYSIGKDCRDVAPSRFGLNFDVIALDDVRQLHDTMTAGDPDVAEVCIAYSGSSVKLLCARPLTLMKAPPQLMVQLEAVAQVTITYGI